MQSSIKDTNEKNNQMITADKNEQEYIVSFKFLKDNKDKNGYMILIKSEDSLLEIFQNLNNEVDKFNYDKNENKRDAVLGISALALGAGGIILTKIACHNLTGLIAGISLITYAYLAITLTMLKKTAKFVEKESKEKKNFKKLNIELNSIKELINKAIDEIAKHNVNQDLNIKKEYITKLKESCKEIDKIIKLLNNKITVLEEKKSDKQINKELEEEIKSLQKSIKDMTKGFQININKDEYKNSVKAANAHAEKKNKNQANKQHQYSI